MWVEQGTLSASGSLDTVAFSASLCCIMPWQGANGRVLSLLTMGELTIAASEGGVVSMSSKDNSQLLSSQTREAVVEKTVGGFLREGAKEVAGKGGEGESLIHIGTGDSILQEGELKDSSSAPDLGG